MNKAQTYRDQAIDELTANIDEERKNLYKFIEAHKTTKKLDKPHLIKQTKREIARMLTVLAEKRKQAAEGK